MMKNSLTYLFLLMVLAVLPLTSCEKNEEPQPDDTPVEGEHDPFSDDDQEKVVAYDALSWLQGCLVVVDENGEVFRRVNGEALDESQPDVISVPVADYAAAEAAFLGWVAPGKEAAEVEGGYDYALTDAEGKAQGSVSFRAVEGEAGVVARMTVAPGTDLKQISEVNFIDTEFWPENDAFEKVEAGKIYYKEDYVLAWVWEWATINHQFVPTKKSLPFYCIQGNTDGKEGILVWLCPDANEKWQHPCPEYYAVQAMKYLPTEEQADKVLEFYNNNPVFWANMLKEMDAKGYEWSPQSGTGTTGNSEFLLNKREPSPWIGFDSLLCLDLDDAEGEITHAYVQSYFYYRYMHIKTVPAYNE